MNFIVPLQVNGYPINAVADSTAKVTVISEKTCKSICSPLETVKLVKLRDVGKENDKIEARRAHSVNM